MCAKYILVGNAREVATATSLVLAIEQMFETYALGGGSAVSRPSEFKPKRKGKLMVTLFFLEPLNEVDPDFEPVKGSISFRLMNDDPATVTLGRLQSIAAKIKEKFSNFVWRKGKVMCSYTHWELGYQLQILAIDQNEGKRVSDQILEVQGHSFDGENFNFNNNWSPTQRYPVLPEKTTIAGELIREDRQRPIANVKFYGAEVFFPRISRGFILLDQNGEIIKELKILGKTS